MLQSVMMWLDENEPHFVEKDKAWLTSLKGRFERGYELANKNMIERLAEFYPTLDYTFRSYLLQDFPELKEYVKDIE